MAEIEARADILPLVNIWGEVTTSEREIKALRKAIADLRKAIAALPRADG